MTQRENLLSLYRRKGYEKAPVEFGLCPSLEAIFRVKTESDLPYDDYFNFPRRCVSDGILPEIDTEIFRTYYDFELKPGTHISVWGMAHEPGSEAAKHMSYMRHPLKNCDSLQMMQDYPFPDYAKASFAHQSAEVESIHARGLAAVGDMQCTIWEIAWYIRGMEELMMDMMTDDPMAEFILDKVAEQSLIRAKAYVRAGCDILFFGDDVGMQRSIMMSERLYCDWLKPRLKNLISEIRKEKPDIIIMYHSCGFVTPLIPHLIDAGIDVLNPVQPECMDFKEIYEKCGDKLSFNGTIGTQTTMPFGTPDDVRKMVFKNLELAGDKGGLLCCPTHLLEPEVPWENVEAYVKACRDFK
jgi:Uroporphyrinogen-III decarboxylase